MMVGSIWYIVMVYYDSGGQLDLSLSKDIPEDDEYAYYHPSNDSSQISNK